MVGIAAAKARPASTAILVSRLIRLTSSAARQEVGASALLPRHKAEGSRQFMVL